MINPKNGEIVYFDVQKRLATKTNRLAQFQMSGNVNVKHRFVLGSEFEHQKPQIGFKVGRV